MKWLGFLLLIVVSTGCTKSSSSSIVEDVNTISNSSLKSVQWNSETVIADPRIIGSVSNYDWPTILEDVEDRLFDSISTVDSITTYQVDVGTESNPMVLNLNFDFIDED